MSSADEVRQLDSLLETLQWIKKHDLVSGPQLITLARTFSQVSQLDRDGIRDIDVAQKTLLP